MLQVVHLCQWSSMIWGSGNPSVDSLAMSRDHSLIPNPSAAAIGSHMWCFYGRCCNFNAAPCCWPLFGQTIGLAFRPNQQILVQRENTRTWVLQSCSWYLADQGQPRQQDARASEAKVVDGFVCVCWCLGLPTSYLPLQNLSTPGIPLLHLSTLWMLRGGLNISNSKHTPVFFPACEIARLSHCFDAPAWNPQLLEFWTPTYVGLKTAAKHNLYRPEIRRVSFRNYPIIHPASCSTGCTWLIDLSH